MSGRQQTGTWIWVAVCDALAHGLGDGRKVIHPVGGGPVPQAQVAQEGGQEPASQPAHPLRLDVAGVIPLKLTQMVVLSYNSYASHPRIDCRGDRPEVIKAGAWGCPPYQPDAKPLFRTFPTE
jgi:hypothetical protein